MTKRRSSMLSPRELRRLREDTDDSDAENVELLPFADVNGRSSPLHPRQRPGSFLNSCFTHAKDWAGKDSQARRWASVLIHILYLVAITPLALAARIALFCFGTGARRTRSQQRCRLFCGACALVTGAIALVAILTALFKPSYTHRPPQYVAFRQVCEANNELGRANLLDQRVFIAASLYDPNGELLRGGWAGLVLRLIDLIGPQNTHLSIYLSDSGEVGDQALAEFAGRMHSPHTFAFSDHVNIEGSPIINMPDGAPATKRLEYLARARNIALEPLEKEGHFDKIFFLNDVWFDPIEAAQLIFLTNTKPYDLPSKEKSNYRAACAIDLDNPFKYYDTFATRDLDGYSLGVPIYPWFTTSGRGESRRDVLRQRDAVRVKSCWGGMVAFDARYFQRRVPPKLLNPANPNTRDATLTQSQVQFRSVPELDFESSECCLINADLSAASPIGPPHQQSIPDDTDAGIYMNPYIRTAYNEWVFDHNWIGRRFERLLLPIHGLINIFAGLPFRNDRRTVAAGESIVKTVWEPTPGFSSGAAQPGPQDLTYIMGTVEGVEERSLKFENRSASDTRTSSTGGRWVRKSVPATNGEFCAIPNLMVRRLDPLPGEKSWELYKVPLDGEMASLNPVHEP